jgi:hypothetical protein
VRRECCFRTGLTDQCDMPKGKRKPIRGSVGTGSVVTADRKGILRCDGEHGSTKSTREL